MTVDPLPELPRVQALNGNSFDSVFFSRLVWLSGPTRELKSSQRELLSFFNRSRQKSMSQKLKVAQAKGFLKKTRNSQGLLPDAYIRGDFFAKDNSESRNFVTLATSLWGTNGLLRDWQYPAAWGFGCMKTGVLLCLATLKKVDQSMSRKSLRKYLTPLVSESSFNESISILTTRQMVIQSNGELVLAKDWEDKLQHWLETIPACNQRKQKGDGRRRAEQLANRMRVRKQILTNAELYLLLKLPCVVKGCKRKSCELEHFPPRRFLKDFDDITNKNLVWAICKKHNQEKANFIKRLNVNTSIKSEQLEIKAKVAPLNIYRTVANLRMQDYERAFRNNDPVGAAIAIQSVLMLWKAVSQMPCNNPILTKDRIPLQRRKIIGKSPHKTHQSQLN